MLLACSSWGWLQSSPSSGPQPSVAEIATSYRTYQQITKSVVHVDPLLSMLCRGMSKEEVEAARARSGPHANTGILIYMNKLAADAFNASATSFPAGAVIVKQKEIVGPKDKDWRRLRESDDGVGGMVKRPTGYDPEHGDWEYFYFEDTAKIESGPIPTCVQCHSSAKDKDYVFGTWRKTGN